MENKKFSRILTPGINVYLWIIFVCVFVIEIYKRKYAAIGYVIFAYLVYHNAKSKYLRTKEITKYIENLTFHVDSATKDTLLHFPIPMVVLQLNGIITWYNPEFAKIFKGQSLLEKPINSFVEDLQVARLIDNENKNNISIELTHDNNHYNIIGNIVEIKENSVSNYMIMLYWIDSTELTDLKEKYKSEKVVSSIIMVDNYEEMLQSTSDENQAQLLAEIDRRITQWTSVAEGVLKKFERDKYLFMFEKRYLSILEENKFDILDRVKEINIGNTIPVTLSIGIGLNGGSITVNDTYSRAAIDIALGRGGDQVVIKDGDELRFLGGKSKELEKRTRVKARVVAYALRELISQAEQVIIMGHKSGDVDSVGASVGLYRVAKNKEKDAYIVLNSYEPTVKNMVYRLNKDEEYNDVFISGEQALELVTDKTLIVVVDTHRTSFTDEPALLELSKHVVVIDHHRRGAEFIEKALLVYHEPYASSTCEMVTEIIQYLEEDVILKAPEAEALYAGIAVDTKNFSFSTGVRTFEAASYLRRAGVDTSAVKQFFQSDMDIYVARANIVKRAEIINDNLALSVFTDNVKNAHLIIAQAADELLNIKGITVSFVMTKVNDAVIISGRSFGEVNVQVILEKLGGGGHLSVAGAQIPNVSIEEAKESLKKAISEYIEENKKKSE